MKYYFLLFSTVLFFSGNPPHTTEEKKLGLQEPPPISQESIQTRAFIVLQKKCNACHATKKKVDIFTYENMDSLSNSVYQQVFVKKKMPKGKKFLLTKDESEALIIWINESH